MFVINNEHNDNINKMSGGATARARRAGPRGFRVVARSEMIYDIIVCIIVIIVICISLLLCVYIYIHIHITYYYIMLCYV